MTYQYAFAISAAGMDIERLRVDVATMNLANANVALEASGAGYQPMRVVARAGTQRLGFARRFERWEANPTITLEPMSPAIRQVLDPGHPLAGPEGMVRFPAVDTTTEMMTLMSAMRAYEANVAAMNVSRSMVVKALEIGGV